LWFLVLAPAAAWAQSSITGVVRDESGAVLPGVTVEAASPALIEKVRVAVTDSQGLFRVVDLRPGLYSVTFTLPGFRALRRDGIQLRAEFAATVDAQLSVGAVEETVTVSGEAPLVDIRSTRGQAQYEQETLQSVPGTGRLGMLQQVIPGANLMRPTDRSVGGLNDRPQTNWSMHGAPGSRPVIDGMNYQMAALSQGVVVFNQMAIQEVVVETSGVGADRDTGGLQLNMIMKEGSNSFSGSATFAYVGPSLESSNINDALLSRNLNPERIGSLKKWRDSGFSLGGPIVRNRLWFFGAFREGVSQLFSEYAYHNKLSQPESLLYEPDLSRPGYTDEYARDVTLRLTWQASDRHKIVGGVSVQPNCNCTYNLLHVTTPREPKATGDHRYDPQYFPHVRWTYPASNRLLLEASGSAQIVKQNDTITKGLGQKPSDIVIVDQGLGLQYGAVDTRHLPRVQFQQQLAASYVTGSHNFKTGFLVRHTRRGDIKNLGFDLFQYGEKAVQYRFRNGVPNQVRIKDAPWNFEESVRDVAVYAQDQWTVDRLTLNLGLRFNDAVGSSPEQVLGAGIWVPERRFDPITNVPHWQNLSPRFGAAYDLFGTGRTAVKFSLGRYAVQTEETAYNPARNLTRFTDRTWNDANRNYVPDCDLRNPDPNGECGRWSNLNFGQVSADTRNADDALEGFNLQNHHWEGAVSMQHELAPGIGLNAGYYRTWYGGFLVVDNQAIGASEFDEFCVTAPTDSRLGPSSGRQICGFYDVSPALFGRVDNLVTQATNYGKQSQVYNGVDLTLNARFSEGGFFSGGMSVGRTVHDTCSFNALPNLQPTLNIDYATYSVLSRTDDYCRIAPSWGSGMQAKLMAIYPLPYDIQTSVIYQNVPGVEVTASYVASNAEIAPSLGRNLAEGARGNMTVEVIPPGTMFEPRSQQLDLRFSKTVRLGGTSRVKGNFDVFNIFNANDVLRMVTRYGPAWQDVQQILGGRLLKFSVQFDF
jgi:hypothetical protein